MEGRGFIRGVNKREIGEALDPNSPESQALEAKVKQEQVDAESSERLTKLEVGEERLKEMEQAESETPMEKLVRERKEREVESERKNKEIKKRGEGIKKAEIEARSNRIKVETEATIAELRKTIESLSTDDRMAA
ncbi:MAG: hypothetical protein L3J07_03760 [Candidatus Magasanikbacteria bacterium]|nr:hypothetical protein [Candidatus Magasanikbacteria bacterium]